MDPTGHIAILKKVQEKLDNAKQGLIDATGDFSSFIEQKTGIKNRQVDRKLAETTGVFAGLAGVASDAVGAVNLGANVYFADKFDTPLGWEARQELDDGVESIKNAATMVVERPGAVGLQILDAGKKKALALAAGDPAAMADLYATGTQIATDLALGSKGVKSALSGSRRTLGLLDDVGDAAGLLKKSGRVLDKVEDLADAAPRKGARRLSVMSRSADEVNASFPENYRPPYRPGTRVLEYKTGVDERFVRVHPDEASTKGAWLMKEDALKGLTPTQIQQKYALPKVPRYITDVSVPADTAIRRGRANPNFGGQGRAVQYQLLDYLDDSAWSNTRPLR